jgi:hypothetical protein
MKEMVEKHVGSVQSGLSVVFETELFPYVMVDIARGDVRAQYLKKFKEKVDEDILREIINIENITELPRLIWNPVESFQQKSQRFREELNSGAITINEHRKEFGRPPIDDPMADLPIPILQLQLTLAQLQLTGQKKAQEGKQGADDGKGERTPKKLKPGSQTVDGAGQPEADKGKIKTQPRGNRKQRK